MDFKEYQQLAQRTARKDMEWEKRFAVAGLGLAGEAGEVADMVKKYIGHGHEIDFEEFQKELGDTMWYLQELCHLISTRMELVAEKNIEKLRMRYPEGFTEQASINRTE